MCLSRTRPNQLVVLFDQSSDCDDAEVEPNDPLPPWNLPSFTIFYVVIAVIAIFGVAVVVAAVLVAVPSTRHRIFPYRERKAYVLEKKA